ncbi:MAG: sensor histidine kinase [Planctomycetaceae bacterium]
MRWRPTDLLRALPLRTQLTAWNAAVVILLSAAMLVVVQYAGRGMLYSQADAELRGAANEAALAIREYGGDEQAIVAAIRRKEQTNAERGWFLHLLTANGMTIWQSDHCPAEVSLYPPTDLDRAETVRQVGPYRYVRVRVDLSTGVSYLVRVGNYTTGLESSLRRLILLLTAVGIAMSLVAPVVAWWLAERATKPVRSMLTTAGLLSPTRLGDRLPVRGTHDELDLLAVTINGLLDAVARHVERQERFVADAAHELRGPLAALQGTMEVALARDDLTPDQQDTLSDMLEAARHLSKVANDLLVLAETGSLPKICRATSDLAAIADQTVAMFSGAAEERGITLSIDAGSPIVARGDAVELRRLVSNLLDNAIRFTPPGGRIEVRVAAASDGAILSVKDTGAGIASRDLARVFDRFFKTDPARSHTLGRRSGGLGLAICRSIAESCGGTIGIESQVGKGTTVTVRLPATPAAPEPPRHAPTATSQPVAQTTAA